MLKLIKNGEISKVILIQGKKIKFKYFIIEFLYFILSIKLINYLNILIKKCVYGTLIFFYNTEAKKKYV